MKNKNLLLVLLGIVCVALIAVVGYTFIKDKKKDDTSAGEEYKSQYVTYNGQRYKQNADLRTVLFMGVDKRSKAELGGYPGQNGQSDSLNLLILNKKTKEAQIMQISRDTMVELEVYGLDGKKVRNMQGQICLQYAYGDGDSKSCRLVCDRVSELLGGLKIDSYIAMTIDGIIAAADAVGGVTITVPADYTAIDPSFAAGATVTLKGDLAEKYVRSRDTDVLESNNQRMERQSQFMNALIVQLQASGRDQSAASYKVLYNLMKPFMETNLTADGMKELSDYHYMEGALVIPGEVVQGGEFAEFHIDREGLKEMVINTFYLPA